MIKEIVDWFIISILNIELKSKLGSSLDFFIYDSIKIFLLLFVMITVIGILRSYVSNKKIKEKLSKQKGFVGNILASLFGALTPFCTCSSIPFFIGFVEAGVPLGIAFSFLITSPIINEYMAVIMFGVFGLKITLIYILLGITIGTIGGIVIGKTKPEKDIVKDIYIKSLNDKEMKFNNFKQRISFGLNESTTIIKKIWLFIFIGLGIGAVIHGFVPDAFFSSLISKTGMFSVPLATILGVPLYASCAAIVPIAVVLFQKGLPLGTAMAFMMATASLSLPEAIILRRVMNLKLIAKFFGIVTLGIIVIGYIFNMIM